MATATIGKWGNNLAVRLPGEVIRASGLRDGELVEVAATDDAIVIRRLPRVTLAEVFAAASPADWQAAYADAFDWGPDVGHEVIE